MRALGQGHYFLDRLNAQAVGHGILLAAWQYSMVVGDVYLWLAQAEEPELRVHLPDVPLITHLEVAEDQRNRGIGTELIRQAERCLWEAGFKRVALGVAMDNEAAGRLYRRLGYVEWPHGEVATTEVVFQSDGTRELRPELCRIMTKELEPGWADDLR
ncbi:hypothetical protein Aple_042730 [Acrocarpospora pleiomorpha]|uniref:N-acetyltransferase domain-containing protein n=1 Tax=Acrocarpospora pleiomorpha TaxID=90975 RepID=A0A5M3XIR9_9ACTN|nr:GNAT family N-acetyltransferase [Acrocarpospora pleiomorpha]GES21377.1 hypothetical protein Aple_042730 [Acrocarpospora pleiomorpha]